VGGVKKKGLPGVPEGRLLGVAGDPLTKKERKKGCERFNRGDVVPTNEKSREARRSGPAPESGGRVAAARED